MGQFIRIVESKKWTRMWYLKNANKRYLIQYRSSKENRDIYIPDVAVWGTSPFSDKGVSEPHIRDPILEGEGDVEEEDKFTPKVIDNRK